ncbi:MAG: hypothetical protein NVSMB64_15140 [Candidatus Velthaea sp.]
MKLSTSALALVAAIAIPVVAFAYTGQRLEKTVKVNATQARAIALKALPGAITATELEKETGGSGIRYTFELQAKGVMHEVGVDANTGAVLENIVEPQSEQPGKSDGDGERPD